MELNSSVEIHSSDQEAVELLGLGSDALLVQQNIDQARYLAKLIEDAPHMELMAPVMLNVVCFRYMKAGLDDPALDELNRQIVVEMQERGIAVLSGTTIKGRYVLHVANCNHRSRRADFCLLVEEVERLGGELV